MKYLISIVVLFVGFGVSNLFIETLGLPSFLSAPIAVSMALLTFAFGHLEEKQEK